MIRNLGLLYIERERFLQPESHHAFGFLAICRKCLEIQQSYTHRCVGKHGNDVASPGANNAQGFANCFRDPTAVPHVGFGQIWNQTAF